MGMYDESWCASCGAGMHYTADESAECGTCAQAHPNKLINLIEYIKIHAISLEQDLENEDGADSIVPYLEGAIHVSRHYLSVAEGMIKE